MAEVPNKPVLSGKLDLLAKRAGPAALADKPASNQQMPNQAPIRSDTSSVYFHSSHKTLTILDQNDQKVTFKNHFLVTSDKALAQHIRDHYAKKKTGSIQIREVNHFYYDQSQVIQPQIEALPPADSIFPADHVPLTPQVEKSEPPVAELLNTPISKIPDAPGT